MFIQPLAFIGLILFTLAAAGAEVAVPDSDQNFEENLFLGTKTHPVANVAEIKCILEKTGSKSAVAQTTAENLVQAMRIINFDTAKFTRVCLLHFLAQAKKETRDFTVLTEDSPRSKAATGYGYLQVTGKDNLIAAQKCMNFVSPGLGENVVTSPQSTIGAGGDPVHSAVASMCWWHQNIVRNVVHSRICNTGEPGADGKITHIVNGGSLHGAVTFGETNIKERAQTFKQMQDAEKTCRDYSI